MNDIHACEDKIQNMVYSLRAIPHLPANLPTLAARHQLDPSLFVRARSAYATHDHAAPSLFYVLFDGGPQGAAVKLPMLLARRFGGIQEELFVEAGGFDVQWVFNPGKAGLRET